MATELAQAYISLSVRTDGVPKQVASAINQGAAGAEKAGKEAGNRLASGIGGALKVGGVAAAAAAGGAMGVALTKGFERLTSIDDAQGKLQGLGHSTQGVAKVMESALAAVKGTAFGLGDAATIAASAVAAGVKPGQELTKYLTLTADAASIAGVGMDEMGSIMNGVRTSGSAMTDTLNQLADRGVPIFQWLQEEVGLTGEEFEKFVTDGKVSAEIFESAIQKNIGGAAQAAGKTVRGSFDNLNAAMGRLGAAALKPTFSRLPATFTALTANIDKVTPKVTELAAKFDTKLFGDIFPKLSKDFADLREELSNNDMVQDSWARVKDVFYTLADGAKESVPAIRQIAESLAVASGSLGVSTWQIFLAALEAGAGVLSALVPLLQGLAGVMENNQGIVTALFAAFLLFRTVPAILARVSAAAAPMARGFASANGHMRQAATNIAAVATANGALVRGAAGTSMAMGRFGSAIAQVGRSVPAITSMQQAFVTAANQANRFGRTAGTVSAGMAGIAAAGRGVVSALGGGANVALMGAVVAFGLIASASQSAKSAQLNYQRALEQTEESQVSLNEALKESRGALNDQAFDALADRIGSVRREFEALEAKMPNGSAKFFDFLTDSPGTDTKVDKLTRQSEEATKAKDALDSLGMSNEKLAQQLSGSTAGWLQLRTQLAATGEGGEMAAAQLDKVRQSLLEEQDAARNAVPGMTELHVAMQKFADSTATASDKSNALKTALDALNPDRTAGEAIARHNELIREVAKTSGEAADATQGFGDSLGGVRGIIEGTTANGADLKDTIRGIVDATAEAADNPNTDMASVFAKNQEAFSQLAQRYGVDIGTIQAAADRLGLSDIDLTISSTNAGDVTKELLEVQRAYQHVGAGVKTITLDASQIAASRAQLEQFGFDIQELPNGQVRLTATDAASPILAMVTAKVLEYDGKIGVADIDINKTTFDLKDQEALGQLQNLRSQVTNPEAGLLIDKLLQGKAVSMAELQVLNGTIANPKADMDIAKVMEKLGLVNAELDRIAQQRTARITAIVEQQGVSPQTAQGAVQAGDAVGNLVGYADGGVRGFLPTSARIQSPQRDLVQWAEPETGGEAFIPLAPSKRKRSLQIWQKTGELLGAKFQSYATGGIRAADFDALAQGGFGASRPLTGAPYDWGGINWGDCSGAMSAFANLAAGMPVWGSRFATGSQEGELAKRGARPGRGGPGDLAFGWMNGGPGGGHTAGILPSGKAVEMGGGNDGGMYGGNPNFGQFTDWAHFPGSMFGPTWTDPGSDPGGTVTRPDGTIVKPGDADYSASGSGSMSSSSSSSSSKPSSISDVFATGASAFVKGQVSDLLGIFQIPDSPAALDAYNQYTTETEQRRKQWDEAKKSRSDLEAAQRQDMSAPTVSPSSPSPAQVLQDAQVTYDPSKRAEQWDPYMLRVLDMLGLSHGLLGKFREQVNIESGGDPKAVNTGYTAEDGSHPSGLTQTIQSTFDAFKSLDLPNDIFGEMSNLFAGANYAENDPKYKGRGGLAAIWPTTAGYANGGPVGGITGRDKNLAWLTKDEFVHTKQDYARNKWAVEAIHAGATLEPAMAGRSGGPQVTYNIQAGNTERAFNEAQRLEKKRAAIGLGRF